MGATFDGLDDVYDLEESWAWLGSARYWVLLLSGTGCMGLALAAWESFERQRATFGVVL